MAKTLKIKLPGQSPVTLTAGGFCSPCEAQKLTVQTQAVQAAYFGTDGQAPEAQAVAEDTDARWSGPLVFENQFTGDGRYINTDALRWENLPLPLRWAPTDVGAHGGAMVVGLIETLERHDDGSIWGTGTIAGDTEEGQKVIAGLQAGTIKGVSADLDDMAMEVRVKQELIDAANAQINEMLSDEPLAEGDEIDLANGEKPDENGYTKVYEGAADDEVMYVTDARMRAATLVDIPAFADAYVALDALAASAVIEAPSLVAAAPVAPPAEWFDNPQFDGVTPLTFTKDGRVFGHIAAWGSCHTGYAGACVTPPASVTNYAWFRTGALITASGSEVAVGHIAMDTGHAARALAAAPAAAHYDNTGKAVADVASGEDSYGIWIAGALRPGVTEEQLRALRSSPMSGDWRTVGGNLELVGILAVNQPGFVVPRTKALVASGRTATLITSISPMEEQATPVEPTKLEILQRHSNALRVKAIVAAAGLGE